MSGGLNKAFRNNPSLFMTTHLFNSAPYIGLTNAGIQPLNLANNGTMNGKVVTEVQTGSPNPSTFSHQFSAYYLPWRGKQAPQIQLGTGADYFFTAALTGCRLIIGAGTQPFVQHVDGGHFSNSQMNTMCSTRGGIGSSTTQRYWDNGAFYASVIVGVRRPGGWIFYAQSYDYNSNFPLNVTQI